MPISTAICILDTVSGIVDTPFILNIYLASLQGSYSYCEYILDTVSNILDTSSSVSVIGGITVVVATVR